MREAIILIHLLSSKLAQNLIWMYKVAAQLEFGFSLPCAIIKFHEWASSDSTYTGRQLSIQPVGSRGQSNLLENFAQYQAAIHEVLENSNIKQ